MQTGVGHVNPPTEPAPTRLGFRMEAERQLRFSLTERGAPRVFQGRSWKAAGRDCSRPGERGCCQSPAPDSGHLADWRIPEKWRFAVETLTQATLQRGRARHKRHFPTARPAPLIPSWSTAKNKPGQDLSPCHHGG